MKQVIAPKPTNATYADLLRDRRLWLKNFRDTILADPRMKGRVLDVGCGDGPTAELLRPIYEAPAHLDGVDPMPPAEETYGRYQQRWTGLFENVDIPENSYDALFSVNVIEHVLDTRAFMAQALRVLKPGGAYYALGPHGRHPFAYCVRVVQTLGMGFKTLTLKAVDAGGNDYPAYYKLSTRAGVVRAIGDGPVSEATFYYHPNRGFEHYFPKPLTFIPAAYEIALGTRWRPFMMGFMFRVQKAGSWDGEGSGGGPEQQAGAA